MHSQRIRQFRTIIAVIVVALAAALVFPEPIWAQSDVEVKMMEAHEALDHSSYRTAAERFEYAAQLAAAENLAHQQAEALYWKAFSLQRIGSKYELQRAARTLLQLRAEVLETRLQTEARALAMRVKSELARQGDAQAARELAEMIESMDSEDENLEEKLIALQALMNMNPERALPILEKVLRNREPGTAELRRQAVFLLSQGGAEGSQDLMIDLARNDPDPEVRAQAVFWLGQTGSDEALDFFSQLIASESDPEIMEQAVYALSKMESAKADAVLRDLAADATQPGETRQMALFGLGQRDSAENREFLRSLYSRIDDPELKEQLLHALAQNEDPATADWLVGIALDGNEDIETRKVALFWAGQQGMLPISRLDEMYADIDDREMREQIIFVLSQDESDEAVERLMAIARTEQDPELRKNAVFWIGQSGAPGTEEFLLEIINK